MANIQEEALLVRLRLSQWSARKYDRKVSKEVDVKYNTVHAGNYNKILIALEPLKVIYVQANLAKVYFYDNTLEWDAPFRLLPRKHFMEFCSTMKTYRNKWEQAVVEFVRNYPDLVENAKLQLNSLFQANDYPHQSEIESKFNFKASFDQIADANDFRVKLTDAQVEEIKTEVINNTEDRVNNALKEPWIRLHEALTHISDRLKDKKAKRHHDYASSIKELTEIIPKLNIFNDPELNKISDEVRRKIGTVDMQSLRKDKSMQNHTANEVNKILEQMKGYV